MKIAAGALFVVLGTGLGWLVSDHERPARADVAPPAPSRSTIHVVRSVEPPPRLETPSLPTELDQEPVEQIQRARQLVDDAKSRGEWTDADREALRAQLETLPGSEQADIVAQLADAVNRGTLRVSADLPL